MSKLDITTALVLPPASLGYPATSRLFHLFRSSPRKLFLRLRPRRREETRKQAGRGTRATLTPMTQFLEECESLRWTLVWVYLFIAGGIYLLLAVHVHIRRPLPHERR
jgi:hypothetical protein